MIGKVFRFSVVSPKMQAVPAIFSHQFWDFFGGQRSKFETGPQIDLSIASMKHPFFGDLQFLTHSEE